MFLVLFEALYSGFSGINCVCVQGNLSFQQPVTIYDLIHDTVNSALAQRYAWWLYIVNLNLIFARISEYSTTKNSTIFVGTWNLNGKVCFGEQSWFQALTLSSVSASV